MQLLPFATRAKTRLQLSFYKFSIDFLPTFTPRLRDCQSGRFMTIFQLWEAQAHCQTLTQILSHLCTNESVFGFRSKSSFQNHVFRRSTPTDNGLENEDLCLSGPKDSVFLRPDFAFKGQFRVWLQKNKSMTVLNQRQREWGTHTETKRQRETLRGGSMQFWYNVNPNSPWMNRCGLTSGKKSLITAQNQTMI